MRRCVLCMSLLSALSCHTCAACLSQAQPGQQDCAISMLAAQPAAPWAGPACWWRARQPRLGRAGTCPAGSWHRSTPRRTQGTAAGGLHERGRAWAMRASPAPALRPVGLCRRVRTTPTLQKGTGERQLRSCPAAGWVPCQMQGSERAACSAERLSGCARLPGTACISRACDLWRCCRSHRWMWLGARGWYKGLVRERGSQLPGSAGHAIQDQPSKPSKALWPHGMLGPTRNKCAAGIAQLPAQPAGMDSGADCDAACCSSAASAPGFCRPQCSA